VVYEASGSIAWVQEAPTPSSTHTCAAASDAAGNYYLAGLIAVAPAQLELFLAKFDPGGNVLWMRQYGTGGEVSPRIVAVDPLGGVYVYGTVRFQAFRVNFDAFLVKFDAEGNKVWARQYGADEWEVPTSVSPDPEGGVYITGYTYLGSDSPPDVGDAFLARYSPDGTLLWDRWLDGGSWDEAHGVAADQSAVNLVGTISAGIATHGVTEPRQGPRDAFLAKLTRGGDLLWVRLLGGPQGDVGWALLPGANGDVTVALTAGGLPGIPVGSFLLARHRDARP
jgi:hypothetical protein